MLTTAGFELVQQLHHATEIGNVARGGATPHLRTHLAKNNTHIYVTRASSDRVIPAESYWRVASAAFEPT